nr:MAG TPA: hypothetical protein [Caudoviricetes sp.]
MKSVLPSSYEGGVSVVVVVSFCTSVDSSKNSSSSKVSVLSITILHKTLKNN